MGYCSEYCQTCHWYTDALRKPPTQLLDLVKEHFEVAGWINYKGVQKKQLRDLKYSRSVHILLIVKVAARVVVHYANAALQKALISVLNVKSFTAREIRVKKANMPTFLRLIKLSGFKKWKKSKWKTESRSSGSK